MINGYLRMFSKLGCIKEFLDFLKFLREKYFTVFLMLNYHNFVITKFNNFISNPIMMMHLGNPQDLFSV